MKNLKLSENLLKSIGTNVAKSGISETIAKSEKVIFKKEFNSILMKSKRSQIRNKFLKSCLLIELYASKSKFDAMLSEIKVLQSIAKEFYLKEDDLQNVSDYYTGKGEDKINTFNNVFAILKEVNAK